MFCSHKHRTTPRKDRRGEYERCLDCGARLAWRGFARISQPNKFDWSTPLRWLWAVATGKDA